MEQIIEMFIYVGFGILGGILKIAIDYIKAISLKQKVYFKTFALYFLVVIFISGFSGLVFSFGGKPFSFIGGYAGVDLAGGYEKMFKKTKFKVNK